MINSSQNFFYIVLPIHTQFIQVGSPWDIPTKILYVCLHCLCILLQYRKEIVRFEAFTVVTMKNAVFGDVGRVDLVWTDVSEERIASISRVENSVSEEPAWADWAQSEAICSKWFLALGFFYIENGGDMLLRNFSSHKISTAPHPRRRRSSER
jgi:hypothetical protein